MPPRVTLLAVAFLAAACRPDAVARETRRENWLYGRVDEFEVLSELNDTATARQVRAVVAVRRMINFATGFEARFSQPCLLIFLKDKATFLEYLPADDTVLAERTVRPSAIMARKFLRGTELTALVHFGDAYEDPYARGAGIVHNIFQQITPRPPVWFRLGVGNLIRFSDPKLTWEPERFFRESVQVLPPMTTLLNAPIPASDGLTLDLSEAALGTPAAMLHHHATLFVHYGLFADGGQHRNAMLSYVRLVADNPAAAIDESAFQACFGVTFEEMRERLRGYMKGPALKAVSLPAERKRQLATLPAIELREATPAQVGRIKGDAKALAGYGADARREFALASAAAPPDPELLGARGLLECAGETKTEARAMLEAAVAARVRRPMVYLQLARLRYPEIRVAPNGGGKYSRAESEPVRQLLLQARALKPALVDVYQCYGALLLALEDPVSPDESAILDEGLRFFPGDTELIIYRAQLDIAQGNVTAAERLLANAIRAATGDAARARYEQLRLTLRPRGTP